MAKQKQDKPVEVPEAESEDEFEVNTIKTHRWKGKARKKLELLVAWKGFPDPAEDTWQSEESLKETASEILKEYYASINGRPTPPGGKPISTASKSSRKDEVEEEEEEEVEAEAPPKKKRGRPPGKRPAQDDEELEVAPSPAKRTKESATPSSPPKPSSKANGAVSAAAAATGPDAAEMSEEEEPDDNEVARRAGEAQARLDKELKAHAKEPSWERFIAEITTVVSERQGAKGPLKFFVVWKKGRMVQGWVPNARLREKAPQHMIDFYQSHLRFNTPTAEPAEDEDEEEAVETPEP